MNYKKQFLAISLALFSYAGFLSAATHVAVVEAEKVVRLSLEGKVIQKKLMDKQEEYSKPLRKQEADLKVLEEKFIEAKKNIEKQIKEFQGKAGDLLSEEAKEKKAEEIQQKQQNLEEMQATSQQKFKKYQETAKRIEQKMAALYQKEMTAFDQKIKHTIEEVARKEKWDLVVTKEVTVYAAPSTDKTDVIIEALDKEFSKDKEPSAKKQKTS